MLKWMVQHRNVELRRIGGREERQTRSGDSALLVQSAIPHRILRGDDIVAEITADSLFVDFLFEELWRDSVPDNNEAVKPKPDRNARLVIFIG